MIGPTSPADADFVGMDFAVRGTRGRAGGAARTKSGGEAGIRKRPKLVSKLVIVLDFWR